MLRCSVELAPKGSKRVHASSAYAFHTKLCWPMKRSRRCASVISLSHGSINVRLMANRVFRSVLLFILLVVAGESLAKQPVVVISIDGMDQRYLSDRDRLG